MGMNHAQASTGEAVSWAMGATSVLWWALGPTTGGTQEDCQLAVCRADGLSLSLQPFLLQDRETSCYSFSPGRSPLF